MIRECADVTEELQDLVARVERARALSGESGQDAQRADEWRLLLDTTSARATLALQAAGSFSQAA